MTSHIQLLQTLFGDLRGTLRDNPLIEKDAGLILRKGSYAILMVLLGFGLLGIFALSILASESTSHDLLYWSHPKLFGAVGLSTVVVVVAVVSTIAFPILASASVAGEKERGTFTLLVTSALTPGQIVMGKFVALVVTVAPVFLLVAPFIALSAFGGEVTPADAALFIGYLVVGAVLQLSVGIWVSSLVDRVRFAGPLAVAASGLVVAPLFMFPLFGGVAAWNDSNGFAVMAPAMIFVMASSLGIAAACLLAARSRLAPKALPRTYARNILLAIMQIGLPPLAAASYGLFEWVQPSDQHGFVIVYGHMLPLLYGLVLFMTVIMDVSHAQKQREDLSDAPSPRRAVLMTGARIGAGMFLAVPVAWIACAGLADTYKFAQETQHLLSDLVISAFILTAGFMALASVVSLVGNIVQTPIVKMVVGGAIVLAALFVPFGVAIACEMINVSEWFPLLWMNPLQQITQATAGLDFWDSSKLTRSTFVGLPAYIPGMAVYLVTIAAALGTGRQRPLVPAYRR